MSSFDVVHAIATPAAPATAANIRLSTSICRTSRARPAPRAARVAISRARPVARASSRLAAFVHAISSTSANTASSPPVNAPTYPRYGPGTRVSGYTIASTKSSLLPCARYTWLASTCISACTLLRSPALRIFPATISQYESRFVRQFSLSCVNCPCTAIGAQKSGSIPTSSPVNPAGATPTTVNAAPSSISVFPNTPASPPSFSFQNG